MAAKDADLSRAFTSAEIFLVEELVAEFEIELEAGVSYEPLPVRELFLIEETRAEFEPELGATPTSSGGTGFSYRMRAVDTTLARVVYWSSDTVDPTGINYAGPGPLVSIVVSNVICA